MPISTPSCGARQTSATVTTSHSSDSGQQASRSRVRLLRNELKTPTPENFVVVVSDLDDTVKDSNDLNFCEAISRYQWPQGPNCLAMSREALLSTVRSSPRSEVHYVTSAPMILGYCPTLWLDQYAWIKQKSLPSGEVHAPWLLGFKDFKVNQIKGIINRHVATQDIKIGKCGPSTRLYMLGDSGRSDPEVYHEIVEWAREQDLNIDFHVQIRDLEESTADHSEAYRYFRTFHSPKGAATKVRYFEVADQIFNINSQF